MDREAVTQVRSFNRTVAERIGALTDEFLGRRRPMGNSRTLWEIDPEGVEMRTLRARLGLDSGYASRVLQSLQLRNHPVRNLGVWASHTKPLRLLNGPGTP